MSRALGFPNRKPKLLQSFVSRFTDDIHSSQSVQPLTIGKDPFLLDSSSRICDNDKISSSNGKTLFTRTVEVWSTTCIVTNFGKKIFSTAKEVSHNKIDKAAGNCTTDHGEEYIDVLINPANPELSGVSKFPYFPRGGPVPEKPPELLPHHIMGYVSRWGGVNTEDGMLYPHSVVDGLVHECGGWRLALECAMKGSILDTEKCPVGEAVTTSSGGSPLCDDFDCLVHTVPPFYRHHKNPVDMLRSCYRSSFKAAFLSNQNKMLAGDVNGVNYVNSSLRLSSPLLGSGGRGFPLSLAIQIAAEESMLWNEACDSGYKTNCNSGARHEILAFGIPDLSTAKSLVSTMNQIHLSNM